MKSHSRRPRRNLTAAVASAALVVIAACSSGAGTASAQLTGTKTVNIGLKSLKFIPKSVTVSPGTKLNFVWKERVAHNVVFDKKGPKSKTINKGTWSTSFDKPGTYKYKCTLHPGMNGSVTVK